MAAQVMVGRTLAELGFTEDLAVDSIFVKESVLPVQQVPRRRHPPRPRDALDRRGDGHLDRLRDRLRQGPAGRGLTLPTSGTRLHQRQRLRQAGRPAARAALHEMGFALIATRGHRGVPPRPRRARRARLQGERGAAERRGPHQERRDRDRLQHAPRPGVLLRRRRHPQVGHPARRARRHDAHRHRRDGAGDPGAPRAVARHH